MDQVVTVSRDQHVWSFDAVAEPVVVVEPGTTLEIETWDCFTGQVTTEADTLATLDLSRVNSATGPIGVRGAEPGDSLSVTLLEVRPGRRGAAMCIPEWGQLIEQVASPTTRIFTVDDGVVRMNDTVSFPARPMLGVIGVSPESGDVSTFFAGRHGGNMDDRVHGPGATLHMPVFQSGAQVALGDMHAAMGDGEISGTGVEIEGTARIRLDVVKGRCAQWPVTETADAIYTHGTSASDIDEALQNACEEAARLLVDQWRFTPEDAFMFLSVAGDLGLAQYCHPSPGSVIARMRVPKIAAVPGPFRV
ncbi:MAG TPA: acetamidase/formamidase family protein [Acidimicrobiales bacterium]|nr:acetamidase/formamidase family protein [Acidimicrobiales bacterium]